MVIYVNRFVKILSTQDILLPMKTPVRSRVKARPKKSSAKTPEKTSEKNPKKIQSPAQIRSEFKAKAHSLKPVVLLGNKGLTEAVIAEIDAALTAHELIKIKISGQDTKTQEATVQAILEKTQASLIQTMGHTVTLHRQKAS